MVKKSEILRRFGHRVKTLRIQKGISSQMELALKAGLDRTYIGGVERGERNIALINIEKIARALNLRIRDLTENL
jgi:transcriptional regulator with XRE-family HTH domain